MAYETTNPPRLLVAGTGGGPNMWVYLDGDAKTVVDAAGYFTNGYELGIRANDILIAIDSDDFSAGILICNAATATSVDFTDGLAIATTDTR